MNSDMSFYDLKPEVKKHKKKSKKRQSFNKGALIIILLFLLLIIFLYYLYNHVSERKEMNDEENSLLKKKFRLKQENKKEFKSMKEDIKKANIYIKNCRKGILLDTKKYQLNNNPKISVIIPLYNGEKFILACIRSIQNQSLKNLEIIVVNDNSIDNSKNIIDNLSKEDKRIRIINHEQNKGTLISRKEGVLSSRGEYVTFIDQDDLLIGDILEYSYNHAKKYNIDIVEFRSDAGLYQLETNVIKHKTNIIYQPELSYFMFYDNDIKGISYYSVYLWSKIIKRNIFEDVYDYIGDYFSNQYIIITDDGLLQFSINKFAKTYQFINKLGYFYLYNGKSTSNKSKLKSKLNITFLDYLKYNKFLFEHTYSSEYEKKMAVHFFKLTISFFKPEIHKLTKGFEFAEEVFSLFLNCQFISKEDKNIIKDFADKVIERKKYVQKD